MSSRRLVITFLKRALIVLSLLLVVLILLGLLFFDSIAQTAFADQARNVPGQLTVKRFSPTIWGVRMSGVRWTLDTKEPVFEADEIKLDIGLAQLFRRDWYQLVRLATVTRPGLRVTVDPRGNVNLLRLFSGTTDTPALDLTELRSRIILRQGWIVYHDRRDAGFLYELTGWEGDFTFEDGEHLQFATSAYPNGDEEGLLDLNGVVALTEPRLEAVVGLDDLELAPFTGFPGFGAGITYVRGNVEGSIRATGASENWNDLLANLFMVGEVELSGGAFRSPRLPASLTDLDGKVELLGKQVSTKNFKGALAGVNFLAEGSAGLGPGGRVSGAVRTERFPLSQLRPLLNEPLPVEGEAEAVLRAAGSLDRLTFSGELRGYDLRAEGQTVREASADFLMSGDLLYLSDIVADTPAGQVAGEGWVFLGQELRVLFDLEGRDALPEMVLPGIAQRADFDLTLLGDPTDPMIFGSGNLFGLGPWAQGVSQARGSFLLSAGDLLLYDGVASLNGSRVGLEVGSYDLASQQFLGIVNAENFSAQDLPGVEGISGVFSGRAFVDADLSGPEPVIAAHASLTSGRFAAAGYSVDDATGELYLEGRQVIIPWASGSFQGSRVEVAGRYDTETSGVELALESRSLDLGAFGLAGERANVAATVQGRLDGALGLYGVARSGRGAVAVSGVRRESGQLTGVAWVDAAYEGVDLETVVVASGTPSNLAMEYTGQVVAPQLAGFGPIDLFGAASLAGGQLALRPTLLSLADAPSDAHLYPLTTYSGAAYSFFGPLMSGPLEKVVIEESPFPTTRSVMLAGGASLATGRMDLRFQVRAAGIEDAPFPAAMERLPFEMVSAYGRLDGRIQGTIQNPRMQADFLVPWLLLADRDEDQQRLGLGARGRLELAERILRVPNLTVAEEPFDARLDAPGGASGSGLLSASGYLRSDLEFDVRLRTEGFSADVLAFFAPQHFRAYVPSGQIATDSLHLWGSVGQPNIAGRVLLERGGYMVAGRPYPISSAFADFSSQGGELRISEMGLSAPGIEVSGAATRRADGELEGSIAALDVDLRRLHRFDTLLSGFEGRADLVVEFEGSFPASPIAELGIRTRELTWNPVVIGGRDQIVPIESLVLGVWKEDGPGLLDGLTIAPTDEGIYLEVPDGGFEFVRSAEGLRVAAQGAVTLEGLAGVEFKTFSEMASYFASPIGPDFGQGGEPLRMAVDGLTTSEASLLTGRSTRGVELTTSFDLSLEGQWWRDHALGAGDSLPHYRLTFEELMFESGMAGERSGIQLNSIAALDYRRQGEAGYLSVEDWLLGFFREQPAPDDSEEELTGEDLILRQGVVDAAGRLAITRLPGTTPFSEFNLGAADIPLANLGFLLPDSVPLSGLVEHLEVSLAGVLPSPALSLAGVISDLSVGPLENMRLAGSLSAFRDGAAYRVIVGEGENEGIALSFSDNAPEIHGATVGGETDIYWQWEGEEPDDRLVLFARNLTVSPQSPLRLTATFTDQDLQVLSSVVPGEEVSSGTLRAAVAATGTLERPEFEGSTTLADGRFISERYGRFENLQLDSQLSRISREEATDTVVLQASSSGFLTRWTLARLEGTLGGQPFFGGGVAEFAGIAPTLMDIFFIGQSLPISVPELYVGRADIDLEIEGKVVHSDGVPELRPQLSGLIVLPAGEFTIPLGAVGDASGGGVAAALPLDVALDLSLGSEFFVNALNSRIRAVGDLQLRTVNGMAQLFGRTELSRGTIRIPFYDASFRVRQGLAIFDGPFIPRLEDVEAVADLGGYRITARANGRYPDSFDLDLYSDPPLPQAELSRIAVLGGLPPALTGSGDPNQPSGSLGTIGTTGVSFLSGILTNRLTEQIGNLLFLSELSFDYIPPATYAIKVAKALDPHDRFLLTLTRIIRDSGLSENLFGIEWRFTRTFLARVAFDQLSRLRLWIQSINRF